mmetsp:Transcript_32889/g.82617  ORF Transcript_32889/g.82617 Transcript_32889/m.82617 type:complete len:423 (-) Transcript_32889:407-1675(-)
MVVRSSFEIREFFFSRPPMTRPMAASKSKMPTRVFSFLTAMRAASFTTFAMSAPEKPDVRCASFLAYSSMARSESSTIFLRCTMKISWRDSRSGLPMAIWRSNRPGRSSALSSVSGMLVPASTTTPVLRSNPSISTNRLFSVFSRSSLPPRPLRSRPMASISSMNMMHGADLRASANRSRIRAGPTPTNISTKSDPPVLKNGTDASPATAFASSVLPVPGGPTSRAPRGTFAPSLANRSGCRRNDTNSITSCLASASPATSSNEVVRPDSLLNFLALDFEKLPIMPPMPPLLRRNTAMPTSRPTVTRPTRKLMTVPGSGSSLYITGAHFSGGTLASRSARSICCSNTATLGMLTIHRSPFLPRAITRFSRSTVTSVTRPLGSSMVTKSCSATSLTSPPPSPRFDRVHTRIRVTAVQRNIVPN